MHRIRKGLILLALAGAALAALGGMMFSTAQERSNIGYLDREAIIDAYAGPQISMVISERDRLQELFDQESQELGVEEKQALFDVYESRLKEYEERVGIRTLMGDIDRVFQQVATENGVDVILDVSAIVYGGIDLTDQVADRLGL